MFQFPRRWFQETVYGIHQVSPFTALAMQHFPPPYILFPFLHVSKGKTMFEGCLLFPTTFKRNYMCVQRRILSLIHSPLFLSAV